MKDAEVEALVRYRLEQARTALDDARFLLDGGRSPQSIINRSYYAMYYAVLALLQRRGTVPSKHSGAISLFDRHFVLAGVLPKGLSKDLHRAFELRQTHDYRAIEPAPNDLARRLWEKAAAFVEAVGDHLQSSPDHS